MWFDIAATLDYGDVAPAHQTVANILTGDEIDEGESRSLAWLRNKGYAS
tara:strand:+ start:1816 stop:1962 length:147 start_codon:yes stop_codon:yes gene_type:complete